MITSNQIPPPGMVWDDLKQQFVPYTQTGSIIPLMPPQMPSGSDIMNVRYDDIPPPMMNIKHDVPNPGPIMNMRQDDIPPPTGPIMNMQHDNNPVANIVHDNNPVANVVRNNIPNAGMQVQNTPLPGMPEAMPQNNVMPQNRIMPQNRLNQMRLNRLGI